MRYMLIYDIVQDRARTRVADLCLDYGLLRVQYSAFWGELSRNHSEELLLKIEQELAGNTYNIQLIPICANDWTARRELASKAAPQPVAAEPEDLWS